MTQLLLDILDRIDGEATVEIGIKDPCQWQEANHVEEDSRQVGCFFTPVNSWHASPSPHTGRLLRQHSR